MTVWRQEQVMMMDQVMQAGGLSGRQAAAALGVTEGALRYRRKRLAAGSRDRRDDQPTAMDGFEEAVEAVLAALAPTTRAGRTVSGQLVYEALRAQYDVRGSYPALVRYLRRRHGQQPVRALRRYASSSALHTTGSSSPCRTR